MSYWDIADMSADNDLLRRIQAAAAQEVDDADPYTWAGEHILLLAAQPGWSEAWASAIASETLSPGKDPGVITDGMILSGVQALVATP